MPTPAKLEEICLSLTTLSTNTMRRSGFFNEPVNAEIIDAAIDSVTDWYLIIDALESGELTDVKPEDIIAKEEDCARVIEECLQSFPEGEVRERAAEYINNLKILFQESSATVREKANSCSHAAVI